MNLSDSLSPTTFVCLIMTHQDKLRIHQLDDKSDYSLSHIRVLAANRAKKPNGAISEMTKYADKVT